MDFLLDTSFVIGLWREREAGAEVRFLERHADAALGLPWIAMGEFLAGAVIAGHDPMRVEAFLSGYPLVVPSEQTTAIYARLYASLHRKRHAVGVNDLWIAASAIECQVPLLTRNVKELSRVPGLKVFDYTRV